MTGDLPKAATLDDRATFDRNYPLTSMEPFVRGGRAKCLVAQVLGDTGALRWIQDNSYRHALNFDKVVIGQSPIDGRKLVWHRWHRPETDSDVELHNHRWDFASFVLAGAITAEDYDVDPMGDREVDQFLYHSPGSGTQYSMEHVDKVKLALLRVTTHRADSVYFQPYQVVHGAVASEPSTSTLVMQGPLRSRTTDVFRKSIAGPSNLVMERSVTRYDHDELHSLLTALYHELPSLATGKP